MVFTNQPGHNGLLDGSSTSSLLQPQLGIAPALMVVATGSKGSCGEGGASRAGQQGRCHPRADHSLSRLHLCGRHHSQHPWRSRDARWGLGMSWT
jgi:hypothetical protein